MVEETRDERLAKLLRGYKDAATVKRVYGDPIEKDRVTVIPAARVVGGGGGGTGQGSELERGTGEGSGSGFGLSARPAGAYVIRGDEVTWQPAIDVNRAIAGALIYLTLRVLLRRRRSR